MSLPSAERVVAALRKHPDLCDEVLELLGALESTDPDERPEYQYRETYAFREVQEWATDGWRLVATVPKGQGAVFFVERRLR